MNKTFLFRMRLLPLFLLLFIAGGNTLAHAQGKAVLQGQVTGHDGKGIDYVAVGVVNLERPIGTTTDARGRYRIEVPAGIELQVSFNHAQRHVGS